MEIIQERLEREFNLDLITTAPSVVYNVYKTDGEMVRVENPAKLPPLVHIDRIEEPIVTMTIHVPAEFVGRGARALPGAARRRRRACSTPRPTASS